jgi:hypothetical protein
MSRLDTWSESPLNDAHQQELDILAEAITRLHHQLEDQELKLELFAAKVLKLIEMVAVPGTVVKDQGKVMIRVAQHSTGTLDYFNHTVTFYSDIDFAELKSGHVALHKKVDREDADSADYITCTICGSVEGQMIQDTYTLEQGVLYKTDQLEEHALCEDCYSDLLQSIVN